MKGKEKVAVRDTRDIKVMHGSEGEKSPSYGNDWTDGRVPFAKLSQAEDQAQLASFVLIFCCVLHPFPDFFNVSPECSPDEKMRGEAKREERKLQQHILSSCSRHAFFHPPHHLLLTLISPLHSHRASIPFNHVVYGIMHDPGSVQCSGASPLKSEMQRSMAEQEDETIV